MTNCDLRSNNYRKFNLFDCIAGSLTSSSLRLRTGHSDASSPFLFPGLADLESSCSSDGELQREERTTLTATGVHSCLTGQSVANRPPCAGGEEVSHIPIDQRLIDRHVWSPGYRHVVSGPVVNSVSLTVSSRDTNFSAV